MRSAVERLWAALGRGDWDAMAAQLNPGAVVWQADSGVSVPRDEYVLRHRMAGQAEVTFDHVVMQSNSAAVEVEVTRGGHRRRCAGFYDLRDGRISRGAEYWAPSFPVGAADD